MQSKKLSRKMRAVTPIRIRDNRIDVRIQKTGAKNGSSKDESDATAKGAGISIFDTTIASLVDKIDIDTPEELLDWFQRNDRQNYFVYLYGLGKILKTKQALLQKNSDSLKQKISSTNEDYNSGIREIEKVVPPLGFEDPDASKKAALIGDIVKDVNDSYKTQFNELLQKKIRYDETIEKLKERRSYLVFHLNTEDQGFDEIVKNQIMPLAVDLYTYYRGARYRELRRTIYSYVVICAYNPEIIEKSFILNTSITGPAGSGKTTLARKLANWFSAVGFITKDSYLENKDASYREVGAPELIAQFVGQTAPRTLGVLYGSLEQCLFIDEAYSVAGCSFDRTGKLEASPYGEEFIAVLLPFMANHQGIGCLFVAGYKNLMDLCFFQRNEGLPRRFPTKIDLPLYTTDELYDMFLNFNIIKKQVASIKVIVQDPVSGKATINKEVTEQRKQEFRRAKQILYTGIKPAFLMFHYDTSFSAFEILRKYLLLYEIRKRQFEAGEYTKSTPTHSFTITNHVLTCLLSSLVRRNIIRYYFYAKVFNFKAQNLSLFPAQAGEMGLVADMVNRKIEVAMNDLAGQALAAAKVFDDTSRSSANRTKARDDILRLNKRRTYISIEQETDVFDTYFENKPVRLIYFKEAEDKPTYVEIIKRGYEAEKEKFQEKISEVLIDPILRPPAAAADGKADATAPPPPPPENQWETVPKRPPFKYKQQGGATPLISLQELWEMLFNNTEDLLIKAIDRYIWIFDQVIDELENTPEDKFPVNMLKSEVLNEKILVQFYKDSGPSSGLFTSEIKSIGEAKSKYLSGGAITLQHPYLIEASFKTDPKNAYERAKLIDNADWEDFAFKDKD